MCGGITTMLTSALSASTNQKKFTLALFYNIGRITTYAFIGAVVAFSSSFLIRHIGLPIVLLQFISALFLILLGLYLGQWFMGLSHIEKVGKSIWSVLSPISKNLLPVNTHLKALCLGGLWGWLPCGLVYSTLTWSLASGNTVQGAMIMAAFGLGTLPMMLGMSLGIVKLQKLILHPLFRKTAAIGIITYGIYSLIIAYQMAF